MLTSSCVQVPVARNLPGPYVQTGNCLLLLTRLLRRHLPGDVHFCPPAMCNHSYIIVLFCQPTTFFRCCINACAIVMLGTSECTIGYANKCKQHRTRKVQRTQTQRKVHLLPEPTALAQSILRFRPKPKQHTAGTRSVTR